MLDKIKEYLEENGRGGGEAQRLIVTTSEANHMVPKGGMVLILQRLEEDSPWNEKEVWVEEARHYCSFSELSTLFAQ